MNRIKSKMEIDLNLSDLKQQVKRGRDMKEIAERKMGENITEEGKRRQVEA